jgi:hypothetical protein
VTVASPLPRALLRAFSKVIAILLGSIRVLTG